MTASGDSSNLNRVVKGLIAEWERESDKRDEILIKYGQPCYEKLKRGMLFRLLFLLVHSHKGTIGHGNNYTSQKDVQGLAAEFEVDYAVIDAEVRLEFCAKKHNQVHQVYLDALKGKRKDAKVPKLFSEKWNATD